ncbi:MAG: ABC transporter substrate-binding protein [Rhodospirillaceae bacterium]
MTRILHHLLLACCVVPFLGWPAALHAADEPPLLGNGGTAVTLQLRWSAPFNAAGYYAALWKGFYSGAGLDVTIEPATDSAGRVRQPTAEVVSGRAHFGVGAADILIARDKGADLILLGSVFQTSSGTLYVKRDSRFRTLADLRSMTVLREPGSGLDIEFRAMLLAQGIDPDSITYATSMDENFDAMMGYSVSAPFILERRGIDVVEVRPRDYGINFYGDSLFTSAEMVKSDPATVDAFLQATLQGWDYALRHPHEIARSMAAAFPVNPDGLDQLEYLRSQITQVQVLTGHPVVEPGHVNPERWHRMNETLQSLGMVASPLDLSTFIYTQMRQQAARDAALRNIIISVAASLAVLILAAGIGAMLMREILGRRARALARIEESYRLLVDNLRDYAILGLDPSGRVTNWNRGAERITGFSREEVSGRHVSILFPSADVEAGLPDREIEQARQFGRIEVEGMRARRDGSSYWANVVLSALRREDGAILGFALVIRDASQRKAQEDRIRFQAALLNRVRSAVIAINSEGRVSYMNAYAEALFLLPWRDADNRPLTELAILPEDATTPRGMIERGEQEVTAHRRDGTAFPALLLASVTPDPAGNERSAVYVIHDLTERKKLEATLQHSSNLALLGRMSASLVHEISQPMNVIRLTAEGGLLRLAATPLDTANLAQRFRTVSEQAARLFDTIDFMQTFSRRDAGRIDGTPGPPFDMALAIRNASEMMAERFEAAGIGLELDLPHAVCTARGRSRQFEQVLLNLLGNALHALRLRADQAERRVRVRLDVPETLPGELCLSVEDNGPGIPASLHDQVFEPFYTTKPPGQGTGLGLPISLGIVRSMDGSMEIGESDDLGGAAFVIRLPADHVEMLEGAPAGNASVEGQAVRDDKMLVAPRAPHAAKPRASAALPHVLVVDDEELARREVADYLGAHGFHVSQAAGGIEALEIVQRCNGDTPSPQEGPPIDAVITDIRMPRGNGKELIAHLAEHYPQVFIIVMTGQPLSDREDLEDFDSGADHVLRKPVSLNEIDSCLRTMLNEAAQDG